jgi:hypothetical protein
MRRGPRWAWLFSTLLAVAVELGAAGCTKEALKKKGPDDPLLATKAPAKSHFGDVTAESHGEPTPPPVPTGAWVASPPVQPASTVRLGAPQSNGPAPATFAWSTDKPRMGASTSTPGQIPLTDPYARAADYRWLQGVLERTPGEQWVLRYEALSRDSQGGKVVLEGHARLDLLQPGDIIRVQGQLIEDKEATAQAAWLPHPRYSVSSVRLIQRRQETP